jgi:hypothetical protein
MRRIVLFTGLILVSVSAAAAQQAVPASQSTKPPTLADVGLYVYPAKGQSSEQQQADEQACTQWAESQTGLTLQGGSVDAQAAGQQAAAQTAEATQGAAIAGGAKGSLVGLAIGSISGNAGEGAAIGAIAGGVLGRRERKRAVAESGQAGAEQAQAQNQQNLDAFKQAAGACLQGRGYTVS